MQGRQAPGAAMTRAGQGSLRNIISHTPAGMPELEAVLFFPDRHTARRADEPKDRLSRKRSAYANRKSVLASVYTPVSWMAKVVLASTMVVVPATVSWL